MALLTVAGTDTTAWGWLGAPEIGADELRAVRRFEPPTGIRLAIGEPCHGAEGFRLTHRLAWNAYRIARATTDLVTSHSDVAVCAPREGGARRSPLEAPNHILGA